MGVDSADVLKLLNKDELIRLTLDLCNIDSAGSGEAPVAEFVSDWLAKQGFGVRKIGLLRDRFNVLGKLKGSGGGYSLIFNSHMDTAVRFEDVWSRRDRAADVFHKAWIEDGDLVGEGVVNDKGPMAAFLMAAKAIRQAGADLKGDLLMSAVVGETSHEPADGSPGDLVETQDLGARFLVTHGGVADYALIAEGTAFSIVTVEAGMAWYKITFLSEQPAFYTPYLPNRTTLAASPNMIVRASLAIQALESWADEYQKSHTYRSPRGVIVPKAQIGAIRAGNPNEPKVTPQICSLYLGAFTVPGQDPLALRDEIARALESAGVPASDIELYLFRHGYEAKNADRIVAALGQAHHAIFGNAPPEPDSATCSMWRDINMFNELGIPAITYGPRSSNHAYRRSFSIDSLYQAACVYALTALDVCNQDKPKVS